MIERIKYYNSQIANSLKFVEENINYYPDFQFNTSQLLPFKGKGSEIECKIWAEIWNRYKKLSSPILYWFEILPGVNMHEVFNAIKLFGNAQIYGENYRKLPVFKTSHYEGDSRVLYVGCCESTKLVDRLFWHLGYYRVGATQGIQFCHWARTLEMSVKLHVIQLPLEAKHLVNVYEKFLATELKPIIGKH